jgi:hypothetical protein
VTALINGVKKITNAADDRHNADDRNPPGSTGWTLP